jgi:hypothetical protein
MKQLFGQRWGLAFRLARRDLKQAPIRFLLLVAIVALPVLLTTFAISATVAERPKPAVPGAATDQGQVFQRRDMVPTSASDEATLRRILDAVTYSTERNQSDLMQLNGKLRPVWLSDRTAETSETSETSETAETAGGVGQYELVSGRWPRSAGEVAVHVNLKIAVGGKAMFERLTPQVAGSPKTVIVGTFYEPAVPARVAASRRSRMPTNVILEPGGLSPGTAFSQSRGFVGYQHETFVRVATSEQLSVSVRADLAKSGWVPANPLGLYGYVDQGQYVSVQMLGLVGLVISMAIVAAVFAVGARKQQAKAAVLSIAGAPLGLARTSHFLTGATVGLCGAALGATSAYILLSFSNRWENHLKVSDFLLLGPCSCLMGGLAAARASTLSTKASSVNQLRSGRSASPARRFRGAAIGVVAVLAGIALATEVRLGGAGYFLRSAGWPSSEVRAPIGALLGVVGLWLLIPWLGATPAKLLRTTSLSQRLAAQSFRRNSQRNGSLIMAMVCILTFAVAVSWIGNLKPSPKTQDVIQVNTWVVPTDDRATRPDEGTPIAVPESVMEAVEVIVGPVMPVKVIQLEFERQSAGQSLSAFAATPSLVAAMSLSKEARAVLADPEMGGIVLDVDGCRKFPPHAQLDGLGTSTPQKPWCFSQAAPTWLSQNRNSVPVVLLPMSGATKANTQWQRMVLIPKRPITPDESLKLQFIGSRYVDGVMTFVSARLASQNEQKGNVLALTGVGGASVVVSLLLAWLALALGERDSADERQQLFAAGVGPRMLRRMSLWRTLLLSGTAVVVGLVLGSLIGFASPGESRYAYPNPWPLLVLCAMPFVATLATSARRLREPKK